MYLFLEAYPIVFAEKRGINEAVATLPYIGLILGVLIGCGIVIALEPRYNRKLKANGGIPVPEERLVPMMIGAVLFPIGLFWFGWTGNYSSINWAVPTLSGLLTGAGILTIFLQALNYLIDAYLVVAASSIAANTFLRSFVGAGFRKRSPLLVHNADTQLIIVSSTLRNSNVQQSRRRVGRHTTRLSWCRFPTDPVPILHLWRAPAEDEFVCAY